MLKSLSLRNVALDMFYSPELETPGPVVTPITRLAASRLGPPLLSGIHTPFSESPSSPICSYLFLS